MNKLNFYSKCDHSFIKAGSCTEYNDDLKLTQCIPSRMAQVKKTDSTVHKMHNEFKSLTLLMEEQIGKTALEKNCGSHYSSSMGFMDLVFLLRFIYPKEISGYAPKTCTEMFIVGLFIIDK